MKSKHFRCKHARHCGLIANGRSQVNRDFSCIRNMNCCSVCFAYHIIIFTCFCSIVSIVIPQTHQKTQVSWFSTPIQVLWNSELLWTSRALQWRTQLHTSTSFSGMGVKFTTAAPPASQQLSARVEFTLTPVRLWTKLGASGQAVRSSQFMVSPAYS